MLFLHVDSQTVWNSTDCSYRCQCPNQPTLRNIHGRRFKVFCRFEHIGSLISSVNSVEDKISSSVGFTCHSLQQVACPVSPVNVHSGVHLLCMTVSSVLFIQVRLYSPWYACEAPGSLPDEWSPLHLWLCYIDHYHSNFSRSEWFASLALRFERLCWLGYLGHMTSDRLPRKVRLCQVKGNSRKDWCVDGPGWFRPCQVKLLLVCRLPKRHFIQGTVCTWS